MNRLQSELNRLYATPPVAAQAGSEPLALIDPSNRVRALVMELARPPSWDSLSRVWAGVQTELGLPAPAIAVSGTDGLQLWFALAEPIPAARAQAFLERVRQRFLPDVEPARVRMLPAADASALHPERLAAWVPAVQAPSDNWSAFVARDLAPVFAESPWLDIPPGEEGQANLLRGMETVEEGAFEAAMDKLGPGALPVAAPAVAAVQAEQAAAPAPTPASMLARAPSAAGDPKRFLQQVMDDAAVPLALRIEAAKALLQHAGDRAQPRD